MTSNPCIELSPGDKILVEYSTFGDRFLSVVTDVKKDGTLRVYSPLPQVVVDRFKTDRSAMVRFAYEGRLYGFSSRVENEIFNAGTIIELAPLNGTFDAEERSAPRCACYFPAILEGNGVSVNTVMEDVSVEYTRVRIRNGLAKEFQDEGEATFTLTFHPFDTNNGYSISCSVAKVFMKDNRRYAVLEFIDDGKGTLERIARFIDAQVCCGFPRLY